MSFSLWLGFYILTRSPRSHISWLAALTLWSLSSFFLHNSLAVNLPGINLISWMRYTVVLSLPLWLHLSLDVISTRAARSERPFSVTLSRVTIFFSYAFAALLVGLGIFAPDLLLKASPIPRLFLSDPLVGPLYILIPVYIFLVISAVLILFILGRRRALSATLHRQFTIFLLATALAGSGALYIVTGTALRFDLPIFPGDALLGVGVTMLGYAIAKYNAMIDGRLVERDFLYTALAVGSLTAFYILVAGLLYAAQQISFLTLILVIVGSLSFNALYDGVRVALDRLFYRGQFEQLRSNLRLFAREAGTGRRLNEQLQAIVEPFCRALQIRKGFVAVRDQDHFTVAASLDAASTGQRFSLATLSAAEIIGLVRPQRKGLDGMELLVPLFGGGSQIGAMFWVRKRPKNPTANRSWSFWTTLPS